MKRMYASLANGQGALPAASPLWFCIAFRSFCYNAAFAPIPVLAVVVGFKGRPGCRYNLAEMKQAPEILQADFGVNGAGLLH